MFKVILAGILVASLSACASRGSVSHLDDEVSSMHGDINVANTTANRARNAASVNSDRLDEMDEKIDRAFEKSMTK